MTPTSGLGPDDRPVLALDAATPTGSVAVLRGGAVVAARSAAMRAGADDALLPAVDAVLREAGVGARALAAVVCGAGPGGFTSLRIAAAVAKGIAHATGCPLVAVPSLALAAAARAEEAGPGERAWLVTLDALRGERYAAEVETVHDGGRVRVTGYRYVGVRPAADHGLVPSEAGRRHVDANATPPLASSSAAFTLVLDASPDARVAVLGSGLVIRPVELDAWEPDYGRQAEAQARWETAHGRPLASAVAPAAGA